jgi:hypothetical protein
MSSVSFSGPSLGLNTTRLLDESKFSSESISQSRNKIEIIFDRIKDFFCRTKITQVKRDLWVTFGSHQGEKEKLLSFLNIKHLADENNKDIFKIETRADNSNIEACNIRLSIVIDGEVINGTDINKRALLGDLNTGENMKPEMFDKIIHAHEIYNQIRNSVLVSDDPTKTVKNLFLTLDDRLDFQERLDAFLNVTSLATTDHRDAFRMEINADDHTIPVNKTKLSIVIDGKEVNSTYLNKEIILTDNSQQKNPHYVDPSELTSRELYQLYNESDKIKEEVSNLIKNDANIKRPSIEVEYGNDSHVGITGILKKDSEVKKPRNITFA